MTDIKSKPLPRFDSVDELTEFFENNDLGDYLDSMPEVTFEVGLKKGGMSDSLDE